MFAARFQIGEHGNAFADAREIVNGQLHLRGVRDGEQVQHGVRRAAERDDDGDGVLKRLLREDVERLDAAPQHFHDGCARAAAIVHLRGRNRVLCGAVRQAHAKRFDGGGHRVRCIHAAARTRTGNGALLDGKKFRIVNFFVRVRADGFKNGNNIELALLRIIRDATGQNRSAINEHGRTIQSRHGDERAGHIFIATADGHKTIHARAADDGFNRVGDDFARDERIFHAFAAHRDAVGDRDGVEDDRLATGSVRAFFGFERELVNVHVAGRDVAPCRGDADDGLGKIFLREADGIKHGARGGAFIAIEQKAGVRAQRIGGFVFFHVRNSLQKKTKRSKNNLFAFRTGSGYKNEQLRCLLSMRKILSCLLPFLFAFASAAQTNTPLVQFGEKYTIHSKLLNEDRQYWVYLPPSYKSTRKKYPVLYLTDGEWNFEWACEVAQFMGDALEAPEMIVVGIPNPDRERDLTPTHNASEPSSGGGPMFENFLSEELTPTIDAKFRTVPYRILFGHSIGGVLAVDSFLRQTNGFQAYIAIDPSLWWDNRILVQQAKEFSPRTNSHDALFIAEANWPHNFADATNSNKFTSDLFLAALKTNSPDIRVGWQFFDREDHGSSRLMGLYAGLQFIFGDYKPTNFYALDTPALLDEHFKKNSDRLGFRFLPPEAYVNKIAEAYLTPTNADIAIELFKMDVTNYPKAPTAYSHLANAYQIKGEKELAIQNYKKALELNPNMGSAKKALEKLQ